MEKKNYLSTFETWFAERLSQYNGDTNADAFLKDVKTKVLESYRNGQRSRRPEKVDSSVTK